MGPKQIIQCANESSEQVLFYVRGEPYPNSIKIYFYDLQNKLLKTSYLEQFLGLILMLTSYKQDVFQ